MTATVLIVEDDADLALALSVRLRSAGYRTYSSADAVTAVGAARRVQPDVVLLDLGLPGGDGIDVLERMRSLASVALIPVIVLTARGESARQPALAAGANAFFGKPADEAELLATVDRLVHGDRPQTEELSDLDRRAALSLLRELARQATL